MILGKLKKYLRILKGWSVYHFGAPTEIIYVFSTMRSGSTLLKSLLQENLGITYYPELHILDRGQNKYLTYEKIYQQRQNGYVIAKKPAPYEGFAAYPKVHTFKRQRFILLFRDPNEVLHSIKRMNEDAGVAMDAETVQQYISQVFRQQLAFNQQHPKVSVLVLYEDLIQRPEEEMERLLAFIGYDTERVKTNYRANLNRGPWGTDDISDTFNSGKVVAKKRDLPHLIGPALSELYGEVQRKRHNVKTSK